MWSNKSRLTTNFASQSDDGTLTVCFLLVLVARGRCRASSIVTTTVLPPEIKWRGLGVARMAAAGARAQILRQQQRCCAVPSPEKCAACTHHRRRQARRRYAATARGAHCGTECANDGEY